MKNWLHPNYDVVGIPDGQQALALLEETTFDLIILDLDMPNMTGEDTIRELRARGDVTPVVLLTAESKTSNIQRVMQHGVLDYILKPCSPPDLKQKLESALRTAYEQKLRKAQEEQNEGAIAAAKEKITPGSSAAATPRATPPATPPPRPKPSPAAKASSPPATPAESKGKEQSPSLLMIDDMKSVSRALRRHVADAIRIGHATTKEAAVNTCTKRDYRMIVLDMDMPRIDSVALGRELKKLQPASVLVALYLGSEPDPKAATTRDGFDAFLVKPFRAEEVKPVIDAAFSQKEFTALTDNVVAFKVPTDGDSNRETLMAEVRKQLCEQVVRVASAACFPAVILDLREGVPTDTLGRLLAPVIELCGTMRLEMRVVGDVKVQQALQATLKDEVVTVFKDLAAASA